MGSLAGPDRPSFLSHSHEHHCKLSVVLQFHSLIQSGVKAMRKLSAHQSHYLITNILLAPEVSHAFFHDSFMTPKTEKIYMNTWIKIYEYMHKNGPKAQDSSFTMIIIKKSRTSLLLRSWHQNKIWLFVFLQSTIWLVELLWQLSSYLDDCCLIYLFKLISLPIYLEWCAEWLKLKHLVSLGEFMTIVKDREISSFGSCDCTV